MIIPSIWKKCSSHHQPDMMAATKRHVRRALLDGEEHRSQRRAEGAGHARRGACGHEVAHLLDATGDGKRWGNQWKTLGKCWKMLGKWWKLVEDGENMVEIG